MSELRTVQNWKMSEYCQILEPLKTGKCQKQNLSEILQTGKCHNPSISESVRNRACQKSRKPENV